MAELKNGPLGTVRGKVGNMVASKWRDIHYLRAMGERSEKEATESQKEVQVKFNLMQAFMARLKTALEIGFQSKNTGRATALNLAVKLNSQAFTGVYPDIMLDLPKLVISSGNVIEAVELNAKILATGKLSITWTTLGNVVGSLADDLLQVVLYNASRNMHSIFLNVAERSALAAELEIPPSFTSDEMHIYVFFTNKRGNVSSNSVYAAVTTEES